MPPSARHAAAVERTLAAAGVDRSMLIDASVVAGPPTDALDATRAAAGDERDRLAARRAELADAAAGATAALAVARDELAAAESALAAALQQHRDAEQADADAAEQVRRSQARRATSEAELAEAQRRRDELAELLDATRSLVPALLDAPVAAPTLLDSLGRLEPLADRARDLGVEGLAAALDTWGVQLRAGDAPLEPKAEELLHELADAALAWQEQGSGELAAAPEVLAAVDALDEARRNLEEVEAEANDGGLGQRTRAAIEGAHRRRVELEESRTPDAGELAAARRAETEALARVGFDSILDYRIAVSTGGSGALVDACRAHARRRVAELEEALDAARRRAASTHDELRARIARAHAEAVALVGEPGAMTLDAALSAVFALPEDVADALEELDGQRADASDSATELAAALDQLDAELERDTAARGDAHAALARAAEDEAEAERSAQQAATRVEDAERTAAERAEQLAELDAELAVATAEVERLGRLRYLDEDVQAFRDALVDAVQERVDALDGAGGAVVVDDPLGALDAPDAVAVLDGLIQRPWAATVHVVTSRPALLGRLRHDAGPVRGVDGRRREPGGRRWLRRRPAVEVTG